MLLEISFEYKDEKQSKPTIGYAYFYHKGDDLKTGITKATSHFKKLRSESGWGSKAKLKKITKARNENQFDSRTKPSVRKRTRSK